MEKKGGYCANALVMATRIESSPQRIEDARARSVAPLAIGKGDDPCSLSSALLLSEPYIKKPIAIDDVGKVVGGRRRIVARCPPALDAVSGSRNATFSPPHNETMPAAGRHRSPGSSFVHGSSPRDAWTRRAFSPPSNTCHEPSARLRGSAHCLRTCR